MYIIVVGGGKVGYYLTKTLLSEGHEVLLIEKDPGKTDEYLAQFGAIVVNGDGAEAATLALAGAARADVVVAVTGEDEDNLVISQVAKQKFNVDRTIARVNNPKNEHLFRTLGIDVTVSQTNFIHNLIEQSIPHQPLVHLLNLTHEDIAIIDAKVSEGCLAANKTIQELPIPDNCNISAIIRGPDLVIPTPETVLLPGDDLIAVAHRDSEDALRELLCD
jgi:trk/ktr system potassium uptake protein